MEEIIEEPKLTEAQNTRMNYLEDKYNKNNDVIVKYLDKFAELIREMSNDGDIDLAGTYRVLGYTLTRLTTSTYHHTESEFQAEARIAHKKVNAFFTDFLKEGSEEAEIEDFRVSRLMMFSADLVETILWKNFLLNEQNQEPVEEIPSEVVPAD